MKEKLITIAMMIVLGVGYSALFIYGILPAD